MNSSTTNKIIKRSNLSTVEGVTPNLQRLKWVRHLIRTA